MNPSRGCMKTSWGMGDRMGGAIGMSVPLLEVQMKATCNDDGQATCIISQATQIQGCVVLTWPAQN